MENLNYFPIWLRKILDKTVLDTKCFSNISLELTKRNQNVTSSGFTEHRDGKLYREAA